MPKRTLAPSLAEDLAEALVRCTAGQRRAGRILHDDVGPLLSAAGLRLQILRMDFPEAAEHVREIMAALDAAMDRVRELSQQLNSSVADRVGFQNAMEAMVEAHRQPFTGRLQLRFTAEARLPPDAVASMYEASAAAVADAVRHSGASRIDVAVSGSTRSGKVSVRVKHNGRRRSHRSLAMAAQIARGAGLEFDVLTENGTIVRIQYAFRRPTGG